MKLKNAVLVANCFEKICKVNEGKLDYDSEAELAELILGLGLNATQKSEVARYGENESSVLGMAAARIIKSLRKTGVNGFMKGEQINVGGVVNYLSRTIASECNDIWKQNRKYDDTDSLEELTWEDDNRSGADMLKDPCLCHELVELANDYVEAVYIIDNSIEAILSYFYREMGYTPAAQSEYFSSCTPAQAMVNIKPKLKQFFAHAPENWLEPLEQRACCVRSWSISLTPKSLSKSADRVENSIRKVLGTL